jgi:adenine-specific DNA-methyltransferase
MDSNQWVTKIPEVDLMYLDPPYNKHPYSIYYFMLDIINNWDTDVEIPNTNRGQPKNWNKSEYNSINKAIIAFKDLIKKIKAKFNKMKGIAAYKRKEEWSDVKEFMWLVDTRKN